MTQTISLLIDDVPVTVEAGTTVFDAARTLGISIPVLCHQQNERPVGVCRVCCVDTGERALTAACTRPAENGMVVKTGSDRVHKSRRTLVELLMADHPSPCARQRQSHDCELEELAVAEKIAEIRYPKRGSPRGRDDSSFVIQVDHEACILCDRCIRGCNEIRHNDVLGRMGKGYSAGIAFDLNRPMGNSSCVSCGECMVSCPTGALTNKTVVGTVLPGDPIDTEFLLHLPYFQEISGTFLNLNRNAVVLRKFKAGEIICREGEYGSTAFYIIKGKADVHISAPMAHVKNSGGAAGFLSKLTSHLVRRPEVSTGSSDARSIPIDGPFNLSPDKPTATLGPGDLFGEMTCMSLYPRSATVRAAQDCVMIEMLRNVLDIMLRNKTLRAELDSNYRKRALENHLRSVPLFASLGRDFIDHLCNRVELLRFTKNEVICMQGDIADRFYLVRTGFVKVAESHPDGDLVLAYLGKGGYFGEIGLLGGGHRTATVTALDHVELVSIDAEDFTRMLEIFPDIRRNLEAVAEDRVQQNHHMAAIASVPLNDFLSQGLMEANSLLLLDLEKCTRCDACVRACADAHDGVTRLIREGLRYQNYLVATSCRQCRDPLCMVGCPVGSIRRRETLEVVIEDWCIGCGLCAENCPYGNISIHPFNILEANIADAGSVIRPIVKRKATSCDLCIEHAEPSCVYACPHDAAHRVDPNEFFKLAPASPGR